ELRKVITSQEALRQVHPDSGFQHNLAYAHENLADVYQKTNRQTMAETELRLAIELFEQLLRDAPQVTEYLDELPLIYGKLAENLMRAGRLKDADLQLQKLFELKKANLELKKANLGPDPPDTLQSMRDLAFCYGTHDRHADALPLNEKTLTL